MRRSPLLTVILFVITALAIGVIVVVMSGGNDPAGDAGTGVAEVTPTPSPQPAPQPSPTPQPAPQPAPPAAGGPVPAAVTAWADAVRAAGYEVSVTGGSGDRLARVEVGAAGDWPWRWTGENVTLVGLGTEVVTIHADGAQTLTWPMAGGPQTIAFTSEGFELDIDHRPDGSVEGVVVDITSLTIAGSDGAEPITLERARIVLSRPAAEGDPLIPAGASVTVGLTGLVLPGERFGPFGREVASASIGLATDRPLAGLAAPGSVAAWSAAAAIAVTDLRIDWGLLQLTAAGTLTLDGEGRPAGTLEARIEDILPALDAMNVARAFGIEEAAGWYAALIEARAGGSGRDATVTIELRDGFAYLASADPDLAPLPIATLAPVFAPPQ